MTDAPQPDGATTAEAAAGDALRARQPAGPLSVGVLAQLAGVSVRTLHHYDEIGLLTPSERRSNGHRAYDAADVIRLQRILFYRELELPLDRIHELIDDPEADERDHLRRQHALLGERITRLQRIRDAVATTLEAHDMSINLTPEERLEVFGEDDPALYEAETQQRWGDTDAYRESQRRAKAYSKDDWLRVKTEAEAIEQAWADALAAGEPADGEAAMAIAERARLQIDSDYYPLGHAGHRNLSDMYVEDPRFTEHYDRRAPGLAAYVRATIHANADRAESGSAG